jgi:RimJ/RimL family protein N-acetyltransferase/rhodanese-related sulfurtransferase
VLDGGLAAWLDAGGGLAEELPAIEPTVYPHPGHDWTGTVDADGLRAALAAGRPVVDARAGERYRGEVEPIDPRAGHVPGAVSLPHLDHVGDDRRFRPPADLAARFAGLGAHPVVYCGSGVTACHDLLALEIAGVTGAELYAGSWSDWVSDPDRPVATGAEPGRVSFRRLQRADLPMLGRWLAAPHVARWWEHDPSPEAVEEDFGDGVDGADPVEYHVILLDDREIGMIQRYRYRDEPEWLAAVSVVPGTDDRCGGIDYLIGEADLVGRGIGTEVIAAFVADTWRAWPDVVTLVVDVDPENRASWRVLERNGFRTVWEGELDSPDPRDHGVSIVLRLDRPG